MTATVPFGPQYPPYQPIWIDPRFAYPRPGYTWTTPNTHTTYSALRGIEAFETWREAMDFALQIAARQKPRVRREATPFATRWVVRWTPHFFTINA